MANAGRILLMPKGEYDVNTNYEFLDIVTYGNATWVAKQASTGIIPSDDTSEYWFKMVGSDIANNLATLDAGYVLDARQGKVLKDFINALDANMVSMASDISNVGSIAGNAYSVAVGRNQAFARSTYEALIADLNALPAEELGIGQNIYIVAVGVPDLWISEVLDTSEEYTFVDDETFVNELSANGSVRVGYYKVSQLETQKVDLNELTRLSNALPNGLEFRLTDEGKLQYRVDTEVYG